MVFVARILRVTLASAALIAAATPSLAAPLLSPARDTRTSLLGVSGVQKLVLDRPGLAALRGSDRAVVPAFPLGDRRSGDLVLERFTPFADGVRVEAMDAGGRRPLALPDHVYFRGTVAHEDDSLVVLIAARDSVRGFVVSGSDVFPFGPDARGGHRSYALRDADPAMYPRPGDFCANDLHPEAVMVPEAAEPLPPVAQAPGTLRIADVAIETDQELRARFPSDAATLDYLASLAAATTAIYERDVAVQLRFSYIRLWDTTDPWTATDTSGALNELRTYWNAPANQMATIAGSRTIAHFVSGKSVQGGIAYINVLCSQSLGYGVSQVYGSFDLSRPSQIWDVMVFAHEVGHNFGSPHTHCYSPPLDQCYNQESGCYSGAVVSSRGTIMSYCHLVGGLSNIDLVFGSVVSARIGQTVAAASCLGTVTGSTTSTTSPSTTTLRATTSTTASTTTSTRGTSSSTTATTSSSTSSSTRPSTTTTVRATTTTTAPGPGSVDADGDGVLDAADACPGTPAGELVDATGCSVCPCDGPRTGGRWASRTAYLGCVRAEVKRLGTARVLGRRAQRSALDAARRSSCGRPRSTRCCEYAGPADATGRCRVVSRAFCAAHVANLAATDLGPGSCLPSPCAR
jgi:hypothetical protein